MFSLCGVQRQKTLFLKTSPINKDSVGCFYKLVCLRLNKNIKQYSTLTLCSSYFSYIFPLRDEKDQHDENFLKHHDEDVEDALAQPCCALHWLSCAQQETNDNLLPSLHFTSLLICKFFCEISIYAL